MIKYFSHLYTFELVTIFPSKMHNVHGVDFCCFENQIGMLWFIHSTYTLIWTKKWSLSFLNFNGFFSFGEWRIGLELCSGPTIQNMFNFVISVSPVSVPNPSNFDSNFNSLRSQLNNIALPPHGSYFTVWNVHSN